MKGLFFIIISVVFMYIGFAAFAVTRPDTTKIVTTHWRYFRDSVQVSDTMIIAKSVRDTTLTVKADTIKGKPVLQSKKVR